MKRFHLFVYALAFAMIGTMSAAEPFTPDRPQIIAHRGASAYAPENTLASTVLAWRMGADAVEVDIFMTTDKKLVCIHDYNAKRTTGADIKVFESSYEELRTLDAGSWKGIAFTGEPIPLLQDVIATIPNGKKLFIEVKHHGPEIAPYLKAEIEQSGRKADLIVIGFRFDTMAAVRQAMPDIPVKWLIGPDKDDDGNIIPIDLANIQRAAEAGITSMNVAHTGVTPELVKASHEAGMQVYVWTVNDVAIARRMLDMGVIGITTDVPDVMLREFRQDKEVAGAE